MQPMYRYNAKIIKVIDGDTVDAMVDLGFSIYTQVRFRLYGLDTPEKNDEDPEARKLAMSAAAFVSDTILNKVVTIESVNKDKYGRWLAKVFMKPEQPTLNEQLITLGHAKAYFGGTR